MQTMRSVVQYEFGGPDVLRIVDDVPIPEPFPTEVLLRVHAAGVNPVDAKTREGASVARAMGDFPLTVGWDVAGVVVQVGAGVNRFEPGDRVYGMPRFPYACRGYADYVTAPSRQLVAIPDNLSFTDAAAIPLPATTAYQIVIDTAQIASGDRVLVLGAGGSVGSIAVQLAKFLGAEVTGTDTGERLDRLTALGMDRAIDFTQHEFDDPDLPGGALEGFDVVIDFVGRDSATRAVRLARPGGLVIGVPSGQQEDLPEVAQRAGVRASNIIVEPDRQALEYVSQLIAQGSLHTVSPVVAPLADVVQVHEQLRVGAVKTVLATQP